MFKFIHTADLHLDSPLRGLSRYEGSPADRIRSATRRALENLVQLAVEEKTAFVVIAGDVFDGEWKDYNTGLFFAGCMSRLRAAGIEVYLLAGNHDAASRITRTLRMPDNVHAFSAQRPETVRRSDPDVALHGQGFAHREVTENLAAAYPPADPGRYNIGVLHTAASGRAGHLPYAPCGLDDLLSKGYDYWALGHVHTREVLARDPWIVFPGNPQGRHIREPGPRGCTVVCVDDGRTVAVDHQDLDVLRWEHLDVDVSGAVDGEEVADRVRGVLVRALTAAGGRMLAARVRVHGACPAHGQLSRRPDHWTNQIRLEAADVSGEDIWLEKLILDTRSRSRPAASKPGHTSVDRLLHSLEERKRDPEHLARLAEHLKELTGKLPPDLMLDEDPLDLESPAALADLLDSARLLLADRLLATPGEGG
jgi:DNA repair exonuclease SbcCD nuclease subunit